MGSRVCAAAHEDTSFVLVGAYERGDSPVLGRPAAMSPSSRPVPVLAALPDDFCFIRPDVVIDFSVPDNAVRTAALARRARAALLVGTTGLDRRTLDRLREAASEIAVLVTPNTSLGVAVLTALVRRAAAMLGAGWDLAIVEAHHAAKRDAPSGTALGLAHAARASGASIRDDQIVSVRGGDVVGEHTVRFAAPGEYLELTHRALSRDLFVRGALAAARWLYRQSPGWWTMDDVLGLFPRDAGTDPRPRADAASVQSPVSAESGASSGITP